MTRTRSSAYRDGMRSALPAFKRAAFGTRAVALLACVTVLAALGCPRAEDQEPTEGPPPGTTLRLLVADDPAIAAAVSGLASEWHAQSGLRLEVIETSRSEVAAELVGADAAVIPAPWLGEVADADALQPIPESQSAVPEWTELFDALQTHLVQWGGKRVAVPLSAPVWVCYYRGDILEQLGEEPPATWDDVARIVAAYRQRQAGDPASVPPHALAFPLAERYAGRYFLARSAAYVSHADNFSSWLHFADASPLVDNPACRRAVGEMAEEQKAAPPDTLDMTPADVRHAFWAGRCVLAFTWPSAEGPRTENEGSPEQQPAEKSTGEESGEQRSTADWDYSTAGIVELPGSRDVFDVNKNAWEQRDGTVHVTLIGELGRLGVVSSQSEWPGAAAGLLLWLASEHRAAQVTGKSPEGSPCRPNEPSAPGIWLEEQWSEAEVDYSGLLDRAYSSPHPAVVTLRLPGRARYLDSLDAALRRWAQGEISAEQALQQAAEQWQEITDSHGHRRQAAAFMRSLGQ